jgi:GntR family transcriptional regulator, transcriptional repressor for pyruvate dehydrogenase complex
MTEHDADDQGRGGAVSAEGWADAIRTGDSLDLVTDHRLPDSVAARLEALIDTGEITAGAQLPPERELATLFSVSRATMREALNQLLLKGLISRRPGRGTIVLDRSSEQETAFRPLGKLGADLPEALDFRSVIEPAIAAHAARRATRADLLRLEETARFMEQDESSMSFARLDQQFHELIARACHNPLLVALNAAAVEWMAATRQEALQTAARREVSRRGHRRIYRAIAAADPDAAAAAMAAHINDVAQLLLGSVSQQAAADEPGELAGGVDVG